MPEKNEFKQRLETAILEDRGFPRDIKLLALQMQDTTSDINANTFIPLVLFNREEVIKDIETFKRQLEKMVEII